MEENETECILIKASEYETLKKENIRLKEENKKQHLTLCIQTSVENTYIPIINDGKIVIKGKILETFYNIRAYLSKFTADKIEENKIFTEKLYKNKIAKLNAEVIRLNSKNHRSSLYLDTIHSITKDYKWYQKKKTLNRIFDLCVEAKRSK